MVLTCKLHRLVLTCKSFSVHVCTYLCTQGTVSCKHFGKPANSTRQCYSAKVLIWTMPGGVAGIYPTAGSSPSYKKFFWGCLMQVYKHLFHGLRIIRLCLDLLLPSSPKQLHCKAVRRERGRNWFQDCSGILESLSPQCHVNFVFSAFVFVFMCFSVFVFVFVCFSLSFFVICCSCVPLFLSLSYFPAHPSFQFGRGLSRAMQSTWVAPVNARTPKYRRQKSRRRPIFSLVFKRFKAC